MDDERKDQRNKSQISGSNDWWNESVSQFRPTRRELGFLAAYYFDEARDWEVFWKLSQSFGMSDIFTYEYFLKRITIIREVLGEKACEEALSKSERKWAEYVQEFEHSNRACKNYGAQNHDHFACMLDGENISPLLGRWPELTKEQ